MPFLQLHSTLSNNSNSEYEINQIGSVQPQMLPMNKQILLLAPDNGVRQNGLLGSAKS